MARASSTDFLHNMRFHVEIVPSQNSSRDWLNTLGNTSKNERSPAGFMNVTVPDMQIQPTQYKEGTWVYERKFPGEVSMGGDIQMERGVARGDSSFWLWIRTVAEGSGEYRADLDIKHFHRDQALTRSIAEGGDKPNSTSINLDKPARVYHVFEAFPTQHQVLTGNLDATNGDISIMSITVAYEHFEIEEKPAT